MHRLWLSKRVLDLATGEVSGGATPAELTELELRLVARLHAAGGEAVDRDTLLREVWGHAEPGLTRAVDLTVRRTRRKLEEDPRRPAHLLTVHGVGYRLVGGRSEDPPAQDPHLWPFVGRQAELDVLEAWLGQGSRLISVVGPAGAGKTRLLRQLLLRLGSGVWVSGGLAHAREVVASGGPTVMVWDGLAEGEPGASDQLLAWLQTHGELQVICTPGAALGLPGERCLELQGLVPEQARQLLGLRLEALGGESPGESLDQVVCALDALPGALLDARATARHAATAELGLHLGRDQHAVAMGRMLEQLAPELQVAVARLAALADALEPALIEALGVPAGVLTELRHRGLVVSGGGGRLRLLHTLKAQVVVGTAHLERHGEVVLSQASGLASSWARLGLATQADALFALRPELEVVWQRNQGHALGLEAASLLEVDLDGRLAPGHPVPHLEPALACARRAGAALSEARLLLARGRRARLAGQLSQAQQDLEGSMDLADASEAAAESALARLHLGRLLLDLGRHGEARDRLAQAQGLWEQLGWAAAAARAQVWLGETLLREGQLVDAEAELVEAESLLALHGSDRALGTVLCLRSELAHVQGRRQRARELLEAGIEAHRRAGNRRGQAVALSHLSSLLSDLGELRDALQAAEAAVLMHRQAGSARSEGVVLGNLVGLYLELDDLGGARRSAVQALALHERVGNPRFEGVARLSLGLIDLEVGRLSQARAHLEAADELLMQQGRQPLAAAARSHLVLMHALEHGPEGMAERLEQCWEQAAGVAPIQASVAVLQGVVDVMEGRVAQARRRQAEAQEMAARHAEVRLVLRRLDRALEHA